MANFFSQIFGSGTSARTGDTAAPSRPRDVSVFDRLGLNNSAYATIEQRQVIAENNRKNAAYNALRKTYGDIAGDPVAARQLQQYDQSAQAFPGELENQRLSNRRSAQVIDQSEQAFPGELENQRLSNAQAGVNLKRTRGIVQDEATARRQSAQLNAARLLAQIEQNGGDVLAAFDQLPPAIFEDPAHTAEIRDAIASGVLTASEIVDILSGPSKGDEIVGTPQAAIVDGKPVFAGFTRSGKPVVIGDVTPFRADAGAQETVEGAKARGKAVGQAEGEKTASDLPLSKTELAAAEARITAIDDQFEFASHTIDKAIDRIGPLSAGLAAATAFIPGSPAANLKEELAAAESEVLLSTLTEMKEMSKTGSSGFGQLSNAEGDTLRAKYGSIKTSRSPAALRDALEDFRGQLERSRERVIQAYVEDLEARGQKRPGDRAPAADDDIEALLQKYEE